MNIEGPGIRSDMVETDKPGNVLGQFETLYTGEPKWRLGYQTPTPSPKVSAHSSSLFHFCQYPRSARDLRKILDLVARLDCQIRKNIDRLRGQIHVFEILSQRFSSPGLRDLPIGN